MEKVDCILVIDEKKSNPECVEMLKDLGVSDNLQVEQDKGKALEFLRQGCLIDKKNCPEFIFLEMGGKSINTPEFIETLKKINEAIKCKIQVVFMLDEANKNETGQLSGLGINYLFKPLQKSKLQQFFQNYFFLKTAFF